MVKHRKKTRVFENVLMTIGGLMAILPELVTDPLVIGLVNEALSPGARRFVALAVGIGGFYVRHRRVNTAAPKRRKRSPVPKVIEVDDEPTSSGDQP